MKSWVHYLVILCLCCVEAHPWLHLLLPRFRILDLPVNFAANDWKVHLNKSIETVPNSLLVFVEVWDCYNYIPLKRNKICKNGLHLECTYHSDGILTQEILAGLLLLLSFSFFFFFGALTILHLLCSHFFMLSPFSGLSSRFRQ